MKIKMQQHRRSEEIKRILLDPLTWGQSTNAIVRFTGCPESTVRKIRQRLIAQGLTPANPNSEIEAQRMAGKRAKA